MQNTEPRIVEPVAETFYKLMRQICLEQVCRQNEQSRANPCRDQDKTELSHIRSAVPALSGARS